MYIKRRVKFLLHTRKKGDSENGKNLAIRMRITYAGNVPIDFPTGHSIDAKDWDSENERAADGIITKSGRADVDINKTIDEYRLFANELFARYELLEKRVPSTDEVKDLFNDMIGRKLIFKEQEVTIKKAFEEYIETVGKQNNWSESSYKKNKTVKKHFLGVTETMPFSQITVETLQSFIQTLLKHGMRNTTAQKDYQFVRWFLGWARRKGYYNGNADETFRPRLKGTDGNQKEIIYLTIEELNQIIACEIPEQKNYLSQVRDVFLFCCFTSLRYSDVKALRKADIINGNSIRVVTQKTTDGLIIELNDRAQTI